MKKEQNAKMDKQTREEKCLRRELIRLRATQAADCRERERDRKKEAAAYRVYK